MISTLVERWRLETHTFHLLVDEETITLRDVDIPTDLLVSGTAVSGLIVCHTNQQIRLTKL